MNICVSIGHGKSAKGGALGENYQEFQIEADKQEGYKMLEAIFFNLLNLIGLYGKAILVLLSKVFDQI